MAKGAGNKQKWIEVGYKLFAEIGSEALNAEKLSTIVGLNRSSFYHYFGDMEVFEMAILNYHVQRYRIFGEIIKGYENFEQLFTDEVYQHQDALAFQRQLMINQGIARYKHCHDEARKYTEQKTFELWSAYSEIKEETDSEWILFRALRDYYFVNHGQANVPSDPKEVLVMLHNYLKKK